VETKPPRPAQGRGRGMPRPLAHRITSCPVDTPAPPAIGSRPTLPVSPLQPRGRAPSWRAALASVGPGGRGRPVRSWLLHPRGSGRLLNSRTPSCHACRGREGPDEGPGLDRTSPVPAHGGCGRILGSEPDHSARSSSRGSSGESGGVRPASLRAPHRRAMAVNFPRRPSGYRPSQPACESPSASAARSPP